MREQYFKDRAHLRFALERLQATHDRTIARLTRQNPGVAPEDMLNTLGSPILADLLTPLVIGYAALVNSEDRTDEG